MALRCFLFSSDEEASASIREVLAGLGVEGESCPDAMMAADRVSSEPFQIVIIDWDQQPDAASLLRVTRDRKANERALTLAIVSDDASVPKALQAGANSILRKPILVSQATDTLTTARDLLRAKQESAIHPPQVAVADTVNELRSLPSVNGENEKTLRAGEFLQSAPTTPGGQFETETAMTEIAEVVDSLKELEPMAASVSKAAEEESPAPIPPSVPPPPAPSANEPRGLEWYLKNRTGVLPGPPGRPSEAPPPPSDKPELLGFEQSPSPSFSNATLKAESQAGAQANEPQPSREQKQEAKLFAYMDGVKDEPEKEAKPRSAMGKRAILVAATIAACAVIAAPQAPWHPQFKVVWKRGQAALHAWLNPQPLTTAQAPESHENFGRAGDEYKMPVAENIPDATTDPSQIQVLPIVDPTAKKPTGTATGDLANVAQPDGTTTPATDPGTTDPQGQTQGQAQGQVQVTPAQPAPTTATPANGSATPAVVPQNFPQNVQQNSQPAVAVPEVHTPIQVPAQTTSVTPPAVIPQPAPVKRPQPQYVSTPERVPSSLRSQMASMTPDASGNKPVEAASQAIEPVSVPEATERQLAADQPMVAYPSNVKGQQGTVILQVLIGRDGTVQDAKFQQGSLAFARSAIEGVRQWKFKPYLLNGRPVSVQTTMTMSFKPGS